MLMCELKPVVYDLQALNYIKNMIILWEFCICPPMKINYTFFIKIRDVLTICTFRISAIELFYVNI